MSTRSFVASLAYLLCAVSVCTSPVLADDAAKGDAPMLQYKLTTGQELTYESCSEFDYGSNSRVSASMVSFWVVRQNSDGSWRLIMRQSQESKGSEPRITIGNFDLHPNGRIDWNQSLGFQLDPAHFFVELPQTSEERKNGWNTFDKSTDKTRLHQLQEISDKQAVIAVEQKTPLDAIYLSTSRSVFKFDELEGIVKSIESANTQSYGVNGKGTGLTELVSVEESSVEVISDLLADSELYLEADRKYGELTHLAKRSVGNADDMLKEAGAIWPAISGQLKTKLFRDQVNVRIAQHASQVKSIEEDAVLRRQLIGQKSPDWKTVDFKGIEYSPETLLGNVVVLDFWYRGCGWCIRGMPQIKRLAEAFANDPVIVLGMNTDRQDEDAQFVIDKMDLRYPTLKADDLPEKYKVSGFPTLIILDQQGRIHDLHVGYSPTLFDEVQASITQLLRQASK